jgi:formate hydrogenlyase regulatory protein HycA
VAIPTLIPVSRTGGNYTANIGHYDVAGVPHQFWAQVTSTLTKPKRGADPWSGKRWYAVLHRFTAAGEHVGTEHWFAGTSADGEEEVIRRARRKRDELVAALGEVRFADIQVALFQVKIDRQVFGMVDVSEPGAGEWEECVEMKPGGLMFSKPWRGSYNT